MIREPVPRAQAHSGVALFILTVTILVALVALAPLNGAGKPSGQSPDPGSRLQAKRSVSGSSQPSSPLFLPAVTYVSGGTGLYSVAVADVNRDGKPDIVVANSNESNGDGSVGVLLGNGDGTFRSVVIYDSGGTFSDFVAIADVDGDGKPDLVVANAGRDNGTDGSVGVLLGNGDGTFRPAVAYGSGGQGPISVAVADVNLDGRPDLLVANGCLGISNCASGTVGVLVGNGDGTFQPVVTYDDSGLLTAAIAAADVNGDGKPDMLVANRYPYSLEPKAVGVRLGNGDGTFQSEVFYGISSSNGASSIVAADVNLDGKIDLLFLNDNAITGGVGVLLGNGDGTFQPVKTYASGGSERGGPGLAVADVNGDGRPDLLVANYAGYCAPICGGAVDVLLGKGDGTFQSAVSYSSGGSYGAQSVAVADLNGDRKPDVVVANSETSVNFGGPGIVAVLLHNISKSATATTFVSSLNPSIYGQKITWTATVTSSGSVTPTGKVQFTWSIYTIGLATLNSTGVATFSRSNLNADSYPLTAVYVGDAASLGSTSAVLNQVVLETTSAATLTSLPNPSTQGQAVSFTAKISSPTVIPTGPVTFTAGKIVLGTAQLSGGKATLTISSLAVGSTKVTATYYGDSNIAKSSASVVQTVQ